MNSKSFSPPTQGRSAVPDLRGLSLIGWGILLLGFVLPFSNMFVSSHRVPDADFVGFYSLGRILNEHPAQSLYDYELLKQVCTQVHPISRVYGPLPYPPFVGLFFRPFALLPYWVAYLLWVALTLALYASGLTIILSRFFPQKVPGRSLLLCLAFSYCPFIVDTAANGQLSAIGFFALALAMREDDLGHGLQSGLALSLCLYKPTLLVLLLPMLLVTRRLKALGGFAAGAAVLALATSAFEGFGIWPFFFNTIFSYGKAATGGHSASIRNLSKFVDLTSFSSLAYGGRSWPGLAIILMCACCALFCLLWLGWKSPRMGKPFSSVLWATTVTWTLLLNVYVPVYDSILVVLSVIVTAGALSYLPDKPIHRWFALIWVFILAGSWLSVGLAAATGVQLLTLLFVALGILQLTALRKLARQA
ncbi:MAG: glycosyltransferase 87 family protein [Terracidiphilus sp.]|jgi:hypothetical protein